MLPFLHYRVVFIACSRVLVPVFRFVVEPINFLKLLEWKCGEVVD